MLPTRSIQGVVFPDFDRIDRQAWPHYLEEALGRAASDYQAIVNDPARPDFANTFEALERRKVGLDATWLPFTIQAEADATEQMLALSEYWAPLMEASQTQIMQDPVLFQRCKLAFDNRKDWTPVQERLANNVLRSFMLAGASLEERERNRMLEIKVRLAELGVQVQDKLNAASRECLVFSAEALDGMDATFMEEAAMGREDGLFSVRMLRTTTDAVLANCKVRATREAVFRKMGERNFHGEHATGALVDETLRLRQEMARLLGFPHFADMAIDNYMAKTPANVEALLTDAWNKLMPAAMRDMEIVRQAACDHGVSDFAAWDVAFYTEMVKRRDWEVDTAQVKSYLPLRAVRQAAFDTAEKLFGIHFEPMEAPVYHSDAKAYLVRQQSSGEAIGALMLDYRSRNSKGGGAWMAEMVGSNDLDGRQKPVVVNVCSFGAQEDIDDNQLDMLDASTLFHELGHALHGLLSKAQYPSQAGTNVLQDWVELPSQLLENWITSERGLRAHARHVQTGEPMPEALVDKVVGAARFGQAFQKISYLQSAMLDMAIHQLDTPPQGLAQFQKEVLQRIQAHELLPPWHGLAHFSHLFAGNYAAGYYSYLWAEVMEAAVFELFDGRDLFDPEVSNRIHELVYASGDQVDPAQLFEQLVGRKPSVDALMRRLGVNQKRAPSP